MDEVFREAVDRGIVLGRSNNDLDEQWEIDLSGLPFPIARAATRYLIQNIVEEWGDKDFDEESNHLQDMIFITGVGKAQQKRKEKSSEESMPSTSTSVLDRDRTTSLREFVIGILETDFEPSIESVVPELAQGTVVIEKARLLNWLEAAKGTIVASE